jgi:alpha-aminoadipic semialdehyde synthase
MLPSATTSPDVPRSLSTPLDILAHILSRKLAYASGQRDMCLLHHAFEVVSAANPGQTQTVTASLRHYGTAEASSMSITVGKTLAFAALRVVDGEVKARGVMGPYEREVWEEVLGSLEEAGVIVEDKYQSR